MICAHIVAQPIDLAMEGHEGIGIAIDRWRFVLRAVPGNEIFHIHRNLLLNPPFHARPASR
jgi:hypothetical protein